MSGAKRLIEDQLEANGREAEAEERRMYGTACTERDVENVSDRVRHLSPDEERDPWAHRSAKMRCQTCMWWKQKLEGAVASGLGRCRKHAPTQADGWPATFPTDWCGDHKLDEAKA